MARPVSGSRIILAGSSSPDVPRVRCFEDFDATALLKAKSDGTVTVDTPVPALNKPDRLGYGSLLTLLPLTRLVPGYFL